MHGREGALFDEGQRRGVVGLRLAGEAGYEVGGQAAVREIPAQPLRHGEEGRRVVLAAHPRESGVAAGLQREVDPYR